MEELKDVSHYLDRIDNMVEHQNAVIEINKRQDLVLSLLLMGTYDSTIKLFEAEILKITHNCRRFLSKNKIA